MTKKEFNEIIEEDKKANINYYYGSESKRVLSPYLIDKEIWHFIYLLRKCEYYFTKKSKFSFLTKWYFAYQFKKQSLKLDYTIPVGVLGKGVKLFHRGTIVIHARAKIGDYCSINAGVNIGTKAGYADKVPVIGNKVYIGPGAKIYGDITIADGCAIGANSVVNKSFVEPNCIIAGIPAKVIGKVNRKLDV